MHTNRFDVPPDALNRSGHALGEVHTKPFQDIVHKLYDTFVEQVVEGCIEKCRDDIRAQTRFVTWDLHERSAGALQRSIPPASNLVEVYSVSDRCRHRERSHPAIVVDIQILRN